MKNWKKISLAFLMTAFALSVSAQNGWNGISGTGPKVKKTLNLDSFTAFDMAVSGNVYIKQGNTQSVTIEAQQNIIDNLVTTVSDKNWKIKFEKNVRNYDGLKIWITIPSLTKAAISGSGNIIGESKFSNLDKLTLSISGSGDLSLNFDASSVDCKISGSGGMKLNGVANTQTIAISGSGDVYAENLKTSSCNIRVSGSGDCKVNTSENLDVAISGSGDVVYSGRPKVNAKVSGSGDVMASKQ